MSDQEDIRKQSDDLDTDEQDGLDSAQLIEEQEENAPRSDSLFKVDVPVYEGPMDLLLYVVRQRSVDLIELPVGQVAQDFLDYVKSNPSLDLDSAGEVLLVAAILVRMKVRALLPRDEEEEVEDPDAVAARDEELEEAYREIVAAARKLAISEEVQRDYFPRGNAAAVVEIDPAEQLLKNVTLVTLAEAFRDLQKRVDKAPVHQLAMFTLTVEDMSAMLIGRLKQNDRLSFADIAEHLKERLEVVVAFLAILELIRYRRVRITQDELFGEIWVMRGPRFDADTDAEMHDDETDEDRKLREAVEEESRAEMEAFEAEQRAKQEAREARRAATDAARADKQEESETDQDGSDSDDETKEVSKIAEDSFSKDVDESSRPLPQEAYEDDEDEFIDNDSTENSEDDDE